MTESVKEQFADRGTERMVLSCVLRDPDALLDVRAKLREQDFLSANHRALFSILSSLYDRGVKSYDLMAVINEATDKQLSNIIGGPDYVDALMNSEVSKANLSLYVERVFDCSSKYKLFRETEEIQASILASAKSGPTAKELIASAESRILEVSTESTQADDAIDISIGLKQILKEKAAHPVEVMGLNTGIHLLDKSINGLMPGSLTVIAARQKGGKSTLLMNMACNIAYLQGVPVLYIDTELSGSEVQMRVVSHLSQVPERHITNGTYIENNQYTQNVWRACDVISNGQLFHRYMPGFTMDAVKSLIRKYHAREGIGAVFFDYIKLPEISGSDSFKEHQILGNVATGLKDVAGQLNIPIVAAAQIKRGESVAPKSRFHDSDVADSDRIGRYCNNLLALGKKSKKEYEEDGDSCGTHRLQILLARAGTPSYHGIDLYCNLACLTMRQAEHQSYNMLSQEEGSF